MPKRNATAAVIGAGDYIGAEIAKKFASEGFTVFAGRRNGEKLDPLVKEVEAAGGTNFGPSPPRAKEGGDALHLQRWRQCQFSDSGNHRPRVPESLGDGVLGRLCCGPRGGAADGAARAGQ